MGNSSIGASFQAKHGLMPPLRGSQTITDLVFYKHFAPTELLPVISDTYLLCVRGPRHIRQNRPDLAVGIIVSENFLDRTYRIIGVRL